MEEESECVRSCEAESFKSSSGMHLIRREIINSAHERLDRLKSMTSDIFFLLG